MTYAEISSLILDFWFGDSSALEYEKPKEFWFQSSPQFDQNIKNRFESYYYEGLQGKLDHLCQTPKGTLALVIMLDQFPRNMFRGTPKAFGSDNKALEVSKEALARGFDKALFPLQKMFLYLPFEHSENLEDQKKSVNLFKTLGIQQALDYALEHHLIIARFGRFPHRNAILGRKSTSSELDFLKSAHFSEFGQIVK